MHIMEKIKNVLPHAFWVVVIIGIIILAAKGYDPRDITEETWGKISVVISILSAIFLCFKIYKNEIIDRLILSLDLFMFTLSIGFLGNIPSVLYYYRNYSSVILVAFVALVGVFTFFTPAGFIGVESNDKNKIYSASLKLFAVVIAIGLWCLYFSQYDDQPLLYEWAFPLMIIRIAYDTLGDQVRGKKSKRSWSFKWKY